MTTARHERRLLLGEGSGEKTPSTSSRGASCLAHIPERVAAAADADFEAGGFVVIVGRLLVIFVMWKRSRSMFRSLNLSAMAHSSVGPLE